MQSRRIDAIENLDLDNLKIEDLRCSYMTGQSYLKKTVGRSKEYGYRTGVMTPIGDVLESVWHEAVECIIKRDGEWRLQLRLREWYRGSFDEKYDRGALTNHVSRLYRNPDWVDYQEFQRQNADLLCKQVV